MKGSNPMIEEFEITIDSLWIDHSSYLQSRTDGQGTTCRGAFDDALEYLSQECEGLPDYPSTPLAIYVQGLTDSQVEVIWQAFIDGAREERENGIKAMEKKIDSIWDTDEGRDNCSELPYIYCALSIRDSKGNEVDR